MHIGLKDKVQKETLKLVILESSGKRGWGIIWRKTFLHVYRLFAKKELKTKYFWFFERLKLPPFWWKTKAFKIGTMIMTLVICTVIGVYILEASKSEQIAEEVRNQASSKSESSDYPLPKMYDSTLYTTNNKGEVTYNYLNRDLKSAIERNSEVVGWICIPDIDIDYPIVQTNNNEYYLNHDLDKNSTSQGWVFADYRCEVEGSTPNLVIYGHNLMSGGMFTSLNNLFDRKKDVYVQLQTLNETYVYKVISVYETSPSAKYIRQEFESQDDLQNFFDELLKNNQWSQGGKDTLTYEDKVLTLSTCRGSDKRVVAHCKMIAGKPID